MTSLTAYTPLESLLLFQSLATYGVDPAAFSKTSDLLKNYPYIRDAEGFDGGRLSPDALRELYLRLLKDEAKIELQETAGLEESRNGEMQSKSRKRKAPSPSPPTIQDVARNAQLLPQLVSVLYSRYREQIRTEIRSDEVRYSALQREIGEIERGEWDDKFLRRQGLNGKAINRSLSGTPASSVIVDAQESRSESNAAGAEQTGNRLPSPLRATNGDQRPTSLQLGSAKTEIDLHQIAPSSVNETRPNETENGIPSAVLDQKTGPPDKCATVPKRSPNLHPPTPRLPLPQPASPGSRSNLNAAQQPPYGGPQTPSTTAPLSNTTTQRAVNIHQPTASPIYFVPPGTPQNIARIGQVPGNADLRMQNVQASAHMQHGYPALPYNSGVITPKENLSPRPPHIPGPVNHHNGYAGQQFQPSTPLQSQASHAPNTSQRGGYILPPFQLSLPEPNKSSQQARQVLGQLSGIGESRKPSDPVPSAPVTPLQSRHESSTSSAFKPNSLAQTAQGTTVPKPASVQPTPTSATRWKNIDIGRSGPAHSLPRPRSVSPISDGDLSTPPQSPPKSTPHEGSAQSPAVSELPPEEKVNSDVRRTRSGRKPIQRSRAGSGGSSTLASSAPGRTRSQSVASHVQAASLDGESTVKKIKAEPSVAYPASPEPAPAGQRPATRRRGLVQPLQLTKRESTAAQGLSDIAQADDQHPITPSSQVHPRAFVAASRNFARMSAPIMNDIQSHKHASLFSLPVKEKDVEGYKDIIRRPTDLKSIRAAISAGTKAVNAATTGDTPSGAGSSSGTGGSTIVMLPVAPDLVPPRGIVNSAQLERELMRMFANAVMFNTGDDGVVQDTREMFEAVQQAVSSWRSVERTAAEARGKKGEEPGGEEDEEQTPTAPKRRRL